MAINEEAEMKKSISNILSGTYLSNIAMGRLTTKKNIQMVLGVIFIFVFLVGIIDGLMGKNETLREGLVTYIVFLIPSTLLFLQGLKNGKRTKVARQYNSKFMFDADGMITIHELARQVGKSPDMVLSELEWFFGKGMFQDCRLQLEKTSCVVLSGREGSKTSFVDVVCEKCNGVTRLRVGTYGKCEYCGNGISSMRKK